jgi:hypothetical protein
MYAGMPRMPAAIASAAPWFPDECVATPSSASPSVNDSTAFKAPRILNDPPRCRLSNLNATWAPNSWSMARQVKTGV